MFFIAVSANRGTTNWSAYGGNPGGRGSRGVTVISCSFVYR
jgi:hypothetical protein